MIEYSRTKSVSADQFIGILNRSGLAARRPVNDQGRIATMLKHANLIVTAWEDGKLVGVSRALTDFSYCCYLSDLAVDRDHQNQGIGRKLIDETHRIAGAQTSLILLSAPDAMAYYSHIGLDKIDNGFLIKRAM
jgi:GNAT superfamily N-acetyltransferase